MFRFLPTKIVINQSTVGQTKLDGKLCITCQKICYLWSKKTLLMQTLKGCGVAPEGESGKAFNIWKFLLDTQLWKKLFKSPLANLKTFNSLPLHVVNEYATYTIKHSTVSPSVHPSVGRLVGRLVTFYFFYQFYFQNPFYWY